MKDPTAEPSATSINIPSNMRANMTGNIHHNFLSLIKLNKSFNDSILI